METTLRHFGNSIGLVIPKPLRESLHFEAGQTISIEQKNGGILLKPLSNPKYTLEELLSECDLKAKSDDYDQTWEDMPAQGKEIW